MAIFFGGGGRTLFVTYPSKVLNCILESGLHALPTGVFPTHCLLAVNEE